MANMMTEAQIRAFNSVSKGSVDGFSWLIKLLSGGIFIIGLLAMLIYLILQYRTGDVDYIPFILGVTGILMVMSLYFAFLLY